ncbi:MAG: hypothetical protein RL527_697 [Planctomycetota bacterium]|jgi:glyoxylase-like metal-dependent hydrolase (beta-lactamase superfamily II)
MAAPTIRVLSLGAMAGHPLWGEKGDVRAAHATTTLIEAAGRRIIVDPSLPPQVLLPRMQERTNHPPDAITDVFLTSFQPMRRRGIAAFDKAEWWITEREREASQASLRESLEQAEEAEDRDLIRLVESEMAVLARCRDCEDRLVEGVDLYPMYGVTPGSAGLLVLDASSATLVCGDAIPTLEHLAQGKVFSPCWDLEAAQESFREALEVADVLVLGRDGMIVNPVRRLM